MSITIHLDDVLTEGQATLRLPRMTRDEFHEFCRRHPDLRIERSAGGDLIIMTPTGSETGSLNARITRFLDEWTEQDGTGVCFDSSTLFELPSGAERSPDASWIRRDRWEALTPQERKQPAPICPDFVVELMSPTDRLSDTQAKMEEYLSNGARLGWLINPEERQVHVYRPGEPVQILTDPTHISADPVLPGFTLDLRRMFRRP